MTMDEFRVRQERDRYKLALQMICNPDKCQWTAPAMFEIARQALLPAKTSGTTPVRHAAGSVEAGHLTDSGEVKQQ